MVREMQRFKNFCHYHALRQYILLGKILITIILFIILSVRVDVTIEGPST